MLPTKGNIIINKHTDPFLLHLGIMTGLRILYLSVFSLLVIYVFIAQYVVILYMIHQMAKLGFSGLPNIDLTVCSTKAIVYRGRILDN